jgi:hypothetical protein
MEAETKKPRCWNCIHASVEFKVGKNNHVHCQSPAIDKYFKEVKNASPWESLRNNYNTCEDHEFKTKN